MDKDIIIYISYELGTTGTSITTFEPLYFCKRWLFDASFETNYYELGAGTNNTIEVEISYTTSGGFKITGISGKIAGSSLTASKVYISTYTR